MSNRKLDIAFWNYDRMRPLVDGTVAIEGVDATYHSDRIVTEIFERMIRKREFDVSELGFTYYLRMLETHETPFVALPVFPNRCFRHSAIYINAASGIKTPADLAGKTIGELALYGHDSGVMPKGILADDFGFKPERSRWLIGGIDFPMKAVDFVPRKSPPGVEIDIAPPEADLGKMLESGEIDALISADIPECVLRGASGVGRLFPDYRTVERDYYRRTGIFPIMHTVAVTRELAENSADVVRAVYKGFCDAKQMTQEQYVRGMTFNNMALMIPWSTQLLSDDLDILGRDWWPYGVRANHKAVDAILRYHYEQGLTQRRFQVEEVFVPYLLDT